MLSLTNKQLIWGGDLNAKSKEWGYKTQDGRGRAVLDFVLLNNLILQNTSNSPPSYVKNEKKGWPDLTFTKNLRREEILDWSVLLDISVSDHRYINFKLDVPPKLRTNPRYNTKFCNISKFEKKLKQLTNELPSLLSTIVSKQDLELFTAKLLSSIIEAAEQTLKKKQFGKRPSFRWWSPELRTLRNKTTALKRKIKRMGVNVAPETVDQYRLSKAKYRKEILVSKNRAWKHFCCNELSGSYGPIFKIAHNRTYQPPHVQINWGDNLPQTNTENLIRLAKEIFQKVDRQPNALPHADAQELVTPFTRDEVSYALSSLNPNKAPGIDNVDLRMLRILNKIRNGLILGWANLCLKLGLFPGSLKVGQVLFFPKPGKDSSLSTSYRPVFLLPTLSKILEKMTQRRLVFYLESRELLHPLQYGFRQNKSCAEAIDKVLTQVRSANANKLYASTISVDIQGAFDSVRWEHVTAALCSVKCPKQLHLLISSFLSDRFTVVNGESNSEKIEMSKGCPQGSCLGPVLWLLIVNNYLQNYPVTQFSFTLAFADDIVIIITGKHRRQLESNSKEGLEYLESWAKKFNLTISQSKTTAVNFDRKLKKLKRQPYYKLYDTSITNNASFKYLGVVINKKLTWFSHLEFLKHKLDNFGLLYNIITRKLWGVSGKMMKIWYSTVIEKIVVYAAGAWARDLNIQERAKLLQIQRPFLLKISRGYRTTSTEALQAQTGIPPLDILVSWKAAEESSLRLGGKCSHTNGIMKSSEIQLKNPALSMHPALETFNFYDSIQDPDYKSNDSITEIYTDGSKSDLGTGAGFVVYTNNSIIQEGGFKLHNYNSIFQAEAWALLKALQFVIKNQLLKVRILSDSKSVLDALNSIGQRNPLIQEIKSVLSKLNQEGSDVSLKWVKAHIGIVGNEKVDQLAKKMANNIKQPPLNNKLLKRPISEVKNIVLKEIKKEWQERWSCSVKGRESYSFIGKVSFTNLISQPWITSIVSGHGPYLTYLYRFNICSSNICVCGALGTPRHYHTDCILTKKWHIKPPAPNAGTLWLKGILKNKDLNFRVYSVWSWLLQNSKDIMAA